MGKTVLIVDDDPDLRHVLAAVLGTVFRVIQASGGEEAVAFLRRSRPDMVLLDVTMPGMSGLEVLAEAKSLHPELAVIMLTSRQDADLALKALNLGAVEYVTKPFDAAYIRDEVARLCSGPGPKDDRPWRIAP